MSVTLIIENRILCCKNSQ